MWQATPSLSLHVEKHLWSRWLGTSQPLGLFGTPPRLGLMETSYVDVFNDLVLMQSGSETELRKWKEIQVILIHSLAWRRLTDPTDTDGHRCIYTA
jgi:hypothetical protein